MDVFTEHSLRLVSAVVIGGLIGLDRAFRGRAAGFRTHILVCLASSILMLLMDYQWLMIPEERLEAVRVDPTRMAQGIMTGIGFLGAGVIMQEKQSVRGLTTAASIWITAAIGIIVGAGFYTAALWGTALTLVTLAIFNRLIEILPIRHYAVLTVRFDRDQSPSEEAIKQILAEHKTAISSLAYKLDSAGKSIAYQITMRSTNTGNFKRVADQLLVSENVREFSLRPVGD